MFYPTAETGYRITRAIVPQGSKFQVGAHWHEEYDEYMRVIQGRLKLRLGKTWKVYTPEDGEILIAKDVIHDLCRADKDAKPGEDDEGDMIIEERSDPVDGSKELFFRHAFSTVTDKAVFGWKLPLQQLLVLMYSDTYIETLPGPAGWYATHGLYAVLNPLARLLGLKPFYDEYTPSRLVNIRMDMEGGTKKKKT
ncbi:uncharacterized protein N0V89_008709 [Didymosphaeria variabile]|uniref:Uncharacterized protein n=1 Tax=Didymosphaeria variabile TaxID=1932322 RepID=A0A9W8XGR1_9PLEO|nr:uncharacterized protein N0V89_008709 [Didymosphaeria variabile]KAJ4350088.1 hypothetical protein N0V89_008709 [Didymosphaeria variabile]